MSPDEFSRQIDLANYAYDDLLQIAKKSPHFDINRYENPPEAILTSLRILYLLDGVRHAISEDENEYPLEFIKDVISKFELIIREWKARQELQESSFKAILRAFKNDFAKRKRREQGLGN